jgi:hypothetical protein
MASELEINYHLKNITKALDEIVKILDYELPRIRAEIASR